MGNESMRNIFQDRVKVAQFEVDATSLIVGSNTLEGGEIPAEAVVLGAYIGNVENNLDSAGDGATTAVVVGSTTVLTATAQSAIKGTKIGALDTTPNMVSGAVKLTQAVEVYTAGTLQVGVLYI